MENVSGYILSIVGVVLLGVLIDLILPDGQMNKYIRGIMAFFVVFVMISPVANFVKSDFNFNFNQNNSVELDVDFLQKINQQTADRIKFTLENQLEKNGFSKIIVEIEHNSSSPTFELKKIVINLKNMVMNTNVAHINKYTEIKNIVLNSVVIEEDKIVFDEWANKVFFKKQIQKLVGQLKIFTKN